MAKKIKAVVKVQINAGKATAAPPVGTALGPHGINMGQFIKEYNEKTASLAGTVVPAVVTIFEDRSARGQCRAAGRSDFEDPRFHFRHKFPARRRSHSQGSRRREGLGQAE